MISNTKSKILYSNKDEGHYITGTKKEVEKLLSQSMKNHLLWAGDLDGNGKLDLLFNFCLRAAEKCIDSKLFLSSFAKKDELVDQAGEYYYWDPSNPGC